jgi:hypothetical protein
VRKSAVLSGIGITQRLLEERCRAVSVVNIEAGRVVAFVKLKDGRAVKQCAIHLESLIPKVGLEPTPPCGDRILSPARLPRRRIQSGVGRPARSIRNVRAISRQRFAAISSNPGRLVIPAFPRIVSHSAKRSLSSSA